VSLVATLASISRAALFDYDGDLDVFLPQSCSLGASPALTQASRLFRNDLSVTAGGPRILRFNDVTAGAGVTDPRWSTSAAFLDYDREGDLG